MKPEKQPQIFRLRLPRNARQTSLRMTDQLFVAFLNRSAHSC